MFLLTKNLLFNRLHSRDGPNPECRSGCIYTSKYISSNGGTTLVSDDMPTYQKGMQLCWLIILPTYLVLMLRHVGPNGHITVAGIGVIREWLISLST
jgi:hypothetical protein